MDGQNLKKENLLHITFCRYPKKSNQIQHYNIVVANHHLNFKNHVLSSLVYEGAAVDDLLYLPANLFVKKAPPSKPSLFNR